MPDSEVEPIEDIEVCINHPYSDIWESLRLWMGRGPVRSRAFIRPTAARSVSTGKALVITVVPIEYRNDADSLLAILEGAIRDPWSRLRRAVAGMCLSRLFDRMQQGVADLNEAVAERDHGLATVALQNTCAVFHDALVPLWDLWAPTAVDLEDRISRWESVVPDPVDWGEMEGILDEQRALLAARSPLHAAEEYGLRSPQSEGEFPILGYGRELESAGRLP